MPTDITENDFWHVLNEPEPEIKIVLFGHKFYRYTNDKGHVHRDNDLPAKIWYFPNGNINEKQWYQYYKLHRIGGPAMIWYHHEDGSIKGKNGI